MSAFVRDAICAVTSNFSHVFSTAISVPYTPNFDFSQSPGSACHSLINSSLGLDLEGSFLHLLVVMFFRSVHPAGSPSNRSLIRCRDLPSHLALHSSTFRADYILHSAGFGFDTFCVIFITRARWGPVVRQGLFIRYDSVACCSLLTR